MNYFQTFYRICTGTEVFLDLYSTGWWMAFRRLLYTCFFCSLLFSGITIALFDSPLREGAARFDREFGEIAIQGRSFVPEKSPEEGRSLRLSSDFLITYVPEFTNDMQTLLPPDSALGILWSPASVWGWWRVSKDTIQLMPGNVFQWLELVEAKQNVGVAVPISQLGAQLLKWQAQLKAPPAAQQEQVQKFYMASQITWLEMLMGGSIALFWGAAMLVQTLIFGGLFVLMFGLFGSNYRKMTRKQLWVTMIYAGFPAMLIGTLVQAFDLLLTYNTVYVFGMIGYLLFIVNRIERKLNPAQSGEKNDNSDDSDLDF